jgi:uncharacterized membrane-anchored protein
MSFPVTFTGQMTFPNTGNSLVASNFIKLLKKDLEMFQDQGIVETLSTDENVVAFKLASILTRYLKHPFGSLLSYPKQYRDFYTATGMISDGEFTVDINLDSIVVTYSLNFSTGLKWTLGLLVFSLLLGPIFLVVFGVYFVNVIISIFMIRKYLKEQMMTSQENSA